MSGRTGRWPMALLMGVLAVLVWSGVAPHDRFTWVLEVAPVLIGVPILLATGKRFPLTPLLYTLLAVHACILMVGGKYTYAEVPLGFWVGEALGLARNHYDRLGHFAQGFAPAILVREVLVRSSPLRGSRWLPVVAVAFCLAFSAFYELIEWWTAAATGDSSTAFLGTQGDVWDTQWDMFLALVGAVAAVLTLSRVHDRQLRALGELGVTAP